MQSDDPFLNREEPRDPAAHGPPEQPDMPDPSGPPQPVTRTSVAGASATIIGITVVAAGASFLLLTALTVPTCGATRSSQLQWEQRQAEIDRAIEEAEDYGHVPIEQDTPNE